ncbi:disease resistance protein RPV1-like isoform X2 [Rhododendron vialii]|uniref:disease resistance protein RPV1-like isoform X2 n=1 Tax=Rhododendron vialii TaxID=182163 RepID=UPI00265F67A8|nr:disease resistance protein RPV1-like isoform X2 [Rhododendron vialii]
MVTLNSQQSLLLTCLTLDVFLSFRGPDVRKTFVDHLYAALCRAGFRTFKDDGIEKGEDIGLELGRAIQESRVSIIVFSKNYASSAWCLNELLMILECRRAYGHAVVPVFYDVEPCEVKKQTSSFEEAFAVHEERIKSETGERKEALMGQVGRWRPALKEVGGLFGMHLQNQANGYEAKFIEEITKEVGDKLRHLVLDFAPDLVGLHSPVESNQLWLEEDGPTDYGLAPICGLDVLKTRQVKLNSIAEETAKIKGYSYQYSVVKYRILALQVELMILFSSPLNSWKPSSGLVKIDCDVSPSDVLLKILALDVQSVFVASGQVSLHRFTTNSLFPASPTYNPEL